MTHEEQHKLELVITGCKENWDDITEWEQTFMMDIEAGYNEYGERSRVSFKQWGIIDRIYDKVVGS